MSDLAPSMMMQRESTITRFSSSNRLDQFDSTRSTLKSIFRGIANRINNDSLLKLLTELLFIYNIDTSTTNDIVETADENIKWLETHSNDIQDFLDNFFRSDSSPVSTLSSLIIVFGLAFNWIMQN